MEKKDINSATFNAPVSKVFSYITQARFWPLWHVDSKAVGGVTDRPYVLGDVIYEKGLTDGQDFGLFWHVVEWEKDKKVVLYDKKTNTYLRYTFTEENGITTYSRESKMDRDVLMKLGFKNPDAIVKASEDASNASVIRLQEHIRGLIESEKTSMPKED